MVDHDEGLAAPESVVCGGDGGVLVGLPETAYVEHSVVTAVSSLVSFYNFRLCKL